VPAVSRADELNAKARERRANTCRHFTGIRDDRCKAGVLYAEVRDDSVKPYRWPCLADDCATTCDKRSLPSAEEMDAQDRRFAESWTRVKAARAAIVEATGGARGAKGAIACPNCDGALAFTVASNGHIWGACSTPECARWME
jgi:hypothetical protein